MSLHGVSILPDSGLDPVVADLLEVLAGRIQSGESIDPEQIARDYPEHADRLLQLLPAVRMMAALDRSAQSGIGSPNLGDAETGTLGDFRFIRELGRGGMGVVYEAEQISLNRRVALKVLPFAATMDPRQLQRFRNEAQAAACLHHPNIVPVHGVGCERGVHYYAMQLIEGNSIAEVIAEIREEKDLNHRGTEDTEKREKTVPKSSLCSLCLCGKKSSYYRHIAELIAQAADALEYAHTMGVVHRDIKPGNLMLDNAGHLWITDFGLAKLASPDRKVGDNLTLTGDLIGTLRYMSPEQALAKHGLVDHRTDIYSLGATLYELLTLRPAVQGDDKQELLKHIAFEEPTPLRKIDKSIPAELETITLKCLAKEPGERFASAAELADDLRRWLGDKAIKAKPPGVRERVAKWGRRHAYLVLSALSVTAVIAVALAAIAYVNWKNGTDLRLANEAETRERLRAQGNLQTACDAIGRLLTRLGDQHLKDVPQLENVRATVLEDAVHFYERLSQEQNSDPLLSKEIAMGYDALGQVQASLSRDEDALSSFRNCVRIMRTQAAAFADDYDYRYALAGRLDNLAIQLQTRRRFSEAEERFREAIAIQQPIVAEFPQVLKYREHLAKMHQGLGMLLNATNRSGEAESVLQQALMLSLSLASERPDNSEYVSLAAAIQTSVGENLADFGRHEEAQRSFQEAAIRLEKVVEKYPNVAQHRDRLSHALYSLANEMKAAGQVVQAEATYRKAIPVSEKLVAEFPHTPSYRFHLSELHQNLGWLLHGSGRHKEAELPYRQAESLRKELVEESPRNPTYHSKLGATRNNLAMILIGRGDLAAARRLLESAVDHQQTARQAEPENPEYRQFLRNHYWLLAQTLNRQREYRDAVLHLHKALVLVPEDSEVLSALVWLLATCPDRNVRSSTEAIKLAELAVKRAPNNASFYNTLGLANYHAGNWKQTVEAYEKSSQLAKQGDGPDAFFLAVANWHLGNTDKARKHYMQGMEWLDKNKQYEGSVGPIRKEAERLLGLHSERKKKDPNGERPPSAGSEP